MIKQDTQNNLLVAAKGPRTPYEVVKYHQSFSSLDCTTKLKPAIYPDSKVTTARTKVTGILKNCKTIAGILLLWHKHQHIKPQECKDVSFYFSILY